MGYASFTCPNTDCGATQSPCLHTYDSSGSDFNCRGRVTDDLICEKCDEEMVIFKCDRCEETFSAYECID